VNPKVNLSEASAIRFPLVVLTNKLTLVLSPAINVTELLSIVLNDVDNFPSISASLSCDPCPRRTISKFYF